MNIKSRFDCRGAQRTGTIKLHQLPHDDLNLHCFWSHPQPVQDIEKSHLHNVNTVNSNAKMIFNVQICTRLAFEFV